MGSEGRVILLLEGFLVTESVCGPKWVRAGRGHYSEALLSRYFHGPLSWWGLLMSLSVRLVRESFVTWEGERVVDDTGKKRAKVTKWIPSVHHFKDKDRMGTIRGQEGVFVVWVTPGVTLRVAWVFYPPDPAYTPWAKRDKHLRSPGVPQSKRPAKPPENPRYPSQSQ